jgi:predicted dehydrogenase
MVWDGRLPVLVVGGGMITEEVILPTLFQEQREGRVGAVSVASRRGKTIQHLKTAFRDKDFEGYPDPCTTDPEASHPESYKKALAHLGKHGAVIVATPDHLHTEMTLAGIEAGHHGIVQKPLCLKVAEAHQIMDAAQQKGIYVLTDYHKRHDRAVRAAKYKYEQGELGEMLHGHAWIEEKREMPLEVFARWCEQSSSFEYIGVHYADAYYYITGLKPQKLVAFGQKKFLPKHGKDAFDAIQATIEWEDGSVFFIQTSWVCSEHNSALTNQGLQLSGTEGEYWADHKHRNLHFVTQKHGYEDYNPNFFKPYPSFDRPGEVDWVGYGYDSIVQGLDDIRALERATLGMPQVEALKVRQGMIEGWEATRALPSQALIGTAINEGVRLSIDNSNAYVTFDEGMFPRIVERGA